MGDPPGAAGADRAARADELCHQQILEQIRQSELSAAASMALRAFGPRIIAYLRGMLHEEQAVEDTYGQFCEDLWRGIGSFRGDCHFRTWAFQLAHNAACHFLKDPFRRRARPLLTAEIAAVANEVRESTSDYLRTSVQERFACLRKRLDPEEQALLSLRVGQRLSWSEVAQVMSRPDQPLDETALRKRFERLKARLRELAQAEGLLRRKPE